jgi:outer membrane murein-binding lipoprotein Lpp
VAVRLLVATLLAAALVAAVAGAAQADGDPASDVLYVADVFVPYPPPPKAVVATLKRNVAAAFTKHYRVKVAVVAAQSDLGSVPELFNKPTAYAKFLGQELSGVFVGPLLIVMPSGFGIYDGGRTVAAEQRVLGSLRISGSSADALTNTAATAVQKLTAAGALRSKDIRPPQVYAQPASAKRGSTARLTYSVLDDSERTREVIRISSGNALKAVVRTRMRVAVYQKPRSVTWRVPKSLKPGTLRFCIVATDPTGNHNAPVCTPLTVR